MEEEKGKQRRPSDDEVAPRPAAWRLLDEHAAQVLDALPVTRIFAAFVDEAHTLVPALFCLCLRAAVPFVVVDALLQDRYRLASRGDLGAGRHDPHGPGRGSNVDSAFTDHDGAVDDSISVRKPLPWPSPWVSHCPCRPQCYPWKAADRLGPMQCLRGRLVRVPPRTALRIAAWHWASAVTGCVDTTLRWTSAADVGPYPVPHPQKAADEGGYARDRGSVVRIRPDGTSLIGVWPCGAGSDGARPFEHYGTPVERVPHPWDARIHVDLYDRTMPTGVDGGGEDADMQVYLPFAVARVDGDPVFLVAVYRTTVMVM